LRFLINLINIFSKKEIIFKDDNISKRDRKNVPVIIFDLEANKLFKFKSINEAARFLQTYPVII
jgi:hypothetical protein